MATTSTTPEMSSFTRCVDGSSVHVTVTRAAHSFVGSVERRVNGVTVWGQCGTPEWAEECATKVARNPSNFDNSPVFDPTTGVAAR